MQPHPNPKIAIPIAVVLLAALGVGAWSLTQMSSGTTNDQIAVQTPTPSTSSASPTSSPIPTQSPAASAFPTNWKRQSSQSLALSFGYPNSVETYADGQALTSEESSESVDILGNRVQEVAVVPTAGGPFGSLFVISEKLNATQSIEDYIARALVEPLQLQRSVTTSKTATSVDGVTGSKVTFSPNEGWPTYVVLKKGGSIIVISTISASPGLFDEFLANIDFL